MTNQWNPTHTGSDYKRRDASGRSEREHHLAVAKGHDAQAKRARRLGDLAAARQHEDAASDARREAKRYHPI